MISGFGYPKFQLSFLQSTRLGCSSKNIHVDFACGPHLHFTAKANNSHTHTQPLLWGLGVGGWGLGQTVFDEHFLIYDKGFRKIGKCSNAASYFFGPGKHTHTHTQPAWAWHSVCVCINEPTGFKQFFFFVQRKSSRRGRPGSRNELQKHLNYF